VVVILVVVILVVLSGGGVKWCGVKKNTKKEKNGKPGFSEWIKASNK